MAQKFATELPRKIKIIKRTELPEQKYSDWNNHSAQGCVYNEISYLDIVSPAWSAILIEDAQGICAIFPVNLKKFFGISYVLQPLMTQYSGVLFREDITDELEKESITGELISFLLTKCLICVQCFHPKARISHIEIKKPVHLKLLHTYMLDANQVGEENGFSSSVLNHVRKATHYGLNVKPGNSIRWMGNAFMKRKYAKISELKKFESIYSQYSIQHRISLIEAVDKFGRIHASAAFLFDRNQVIYLFMAIDQRLKTIGSHSLLLSKTMHLYLKNGNFDRFDFKGSAISGVEQFIRGFRAQQVDYFKLEKLLWLVKFAMKSKQWLSHLKKWG